MARTFRSGSVIVAAAAALSLAACGDSSSGTTTSTSSSSGAGGSQSAGGPTSTDPAATAVPGPRLPSATSVPPSRQGPSIAGARCGAAPGPEGALRVIVLAGRSDCTVVTPIARAYGPKISTGREQQVDGWTCGPSQITGVLARCTRGEDAFGLVPQ